MYFWTVHIVGRCRWEEVVPCDIRSDIVGRSSGFSIAIFYMREHAIIARFDIGPPVTRGRSSRRTRRLESRIDRPPSSWIVVLDREIIPGAILIGREKCLQGNTIQSTHFECTICHCFSSDKVTITIDSFRLINELKCSHDSHTSGTLRRHIEDTLGTVSRRDDDIEWTFCTLTFE